MNLFGYFDLGRRAMSASRLGLEVAGSNIANAAVPGYARRRLELTTGLPVSAPGGWLDLGVDPRRIQRMEDRFLEAGMLREQGFLGRHEERFRALGEIEAAFGSLDGDGVASALSSFSAAFSALAGQPESAGARRGAVSAASALASSIRTAYGRLDAQRRREDGSATALVEETNRLAAELATLNREIARDEANGTVAAPLRDRRTQVLDRLSELTGGSAVAGKGGRIGFELPAGVTLVTSDAALPLRTVRAPDGTARILAGGDGADVTDRLTGGRLGAVLAARDREIPSRLAALDTLAADLTTRANAIATGSSDLAGNPGRPLFVPDPPSGSAQARNLAVHADLLNDPALLAVSATGAPGDGSGAASLAALASQSSAALGGRSASAFLAELVSRLGSDVAQADVDAAVAGDMLAGMRARRDSISGVSLDEEAVELIKNQRAFEAAARFLQVVDSVAETAINLLRR